MALFQAHKGARKLRAEVFILIALIFLSLFIFVLRSRNLDRLSLWMDEGFYTLAAQEILHHGYPLYPSGHPLFKGILYSYLLSLVGWLFGPNAFNLRLVSVGASVLVLPLFYFFARKLVSPVLAFFGVIILAFSAWETEYARTVIYFSLLQLVYLACLYLFVLTYLEEKKKYLIPLTILFFLAPHIHQLAMGTIFSFVALFFLRGARRFFRRQVLIPLTIITASYIFIQVHELFFWKVGFVFEKEASSLEEGAHYFFQGFTLAYFQEILRSFPRMGLLVFFGLFLYLGLRLGSRSGEGREGAYLDRWFFLNLNFFLPLIFFGFFRTHIQPRYLFQLHPLLILLFLVAVREIARAITDIFLTPFLRLYRSSLCQKLLTASLVLLLGLSLSDQVGWATTQRIVNRDYKDRISTDVITRSGRTEHYDHRGVGQYVRKYLQPGDQVIAMHMVFQYIYAGRVDYWLWTGGPGTWDAWEKTPEGWKDVYVGARWINSLDALKEVIASRGEHRLWLITSPSIFRRDHISAKVADFIRSQSSRLLFRGRDGMSEVYLWDREGGEPWRRPSFEAEWLPASVGDVEFDHLASRGSYLHFPPIRGNKGPKDIAWTEILPPGEYLLRLALRTAPERDSSKDGRLEITLRTRKSRLVLFSRIVRASQLPSDGEWAIIFQDVNLPPGAELRLTIAYRGERTIDWDYLDFQPKGDNS